MNIGGLLNGTAGRRPLGRVAPQLARGVRVRVHGARHQRIAEHETAPRRARFAELRVPDGVLAVNYIGAPRAAEITPGAQGDYAIIRRTARTTD